MSGAASPSPYTQSVQQVQAGWMANPTARAIGLPVLKKMAAYNSGLMDTAIGAQKQDPTALAKFYGLPSNASTADIVAAIGQSHLSAQGVVPGIQQQQVPSTPTKAAARGGLMSLRGYASGGAPAVQDLTPAQKQAVAAFNATITGGGTPTTAQIAQINNIEKTTGRNVSPYTNTGQAAVGAPNLQNSIATAAASGNYPTGTGTSPATSIVNKYPNSDAASTISTSPNNTAITNANKNAGNDLATATDVKTYGVAPVLDAKGNPTGQITFNDPNFNKAVGSLDQLSQGTGMYGSAVGQMGNIMSGLQGMSNYSPQQVAAQSVQAQQASAQNAAAQQASAQGYGATLMEAPTDISSKNYDAAQMEGPGSWTDPGVQQKYMNPYEQGVIDVAKRQKALDYQKQVQGLNSQALAAGAFGGSGQALQRSQASKDYQQQLQDLEAQGLSQAYQQGMQQYGTESALTQQARQSNQAATNAQRSQFIQQELQAAMTNYGGKLTAAQQNEVAQNAASQFNAMAQNTASITNAQLGTNVNLANAANALQASMTNAQLGTNASIANASNNLAAQQSNQGAGLQAKQLGLGALTQAGQFGLGMGSQGMNIAQGYGQAAGYTTPLGQQYNTNNQQSAINRIQMPTTLANSTGSALATAAGNSSQGSGLTTSNQPTK